MWETIMELISNESSAWNTALELPFPDIYYQGVLESRLSGVTHNWELHAWPASHDPVDLTWTLGSPTKMYGVRYFLTLVNMKYAQITISHINDEFMLIADEKIVTGKMFAVIS